MKIVKTILLYLLALFMIFGGINHFIKPEAYVRIMPSFLPYHLALVYISGVLEVAVGIGILIPRVRKVAAWGLVLLLIAIFPANIQAVFSGGYGMGMPAWALWARLPFQFVLILWAYWFTRDQESA